MFENAQIEQTIFKEIKCEESIIKVDTDATIRNSRFEDNISNNRGTILSVIGTDSEVIVSNTTFFRNSAVMGGIAYLGKNASAEFYDCTFE